jgi:hypothetical protein
MQRRRIAIDIINSLPFRQLRRKHSSFTPENPSRWKQNQKAPSDDATS